MIELDVVEKVDFITLEKDGDTEKLRDIFKPKGDAITLGSLLVTLGASAVTNVIPNLANILSSWLSRHEKRKISIEIGGDKLEVIGISNKEQERLIDAWISRHIKKIMMNKNGHQK